MSPRQAAAALPDPKEMPVRKSPEAPRESRSAFLGDLLDTLTERGRALLRRRDQPEPVAAPDLATLGDLLLSRRGEASGVALARALLAAFDAAGPEERLAFLRTLADRFGPDRAAVEAAIEAMRREGAGIEAVEALHAAAEPRRQELVRRLNLAPGGTAALVRMREELLKHLRKHPELRRVDADFVAPVRLLVQPRLPGAPAHRLDDAGEHPREDHPLRGGARDPATGTTSGTGSSRPTGAATASSTRSSSTSR